MAEIKERLSAKGGKTARTGSAVNLELITIGNEELIGMQQHVILSDKTKKMNLRNDHQKLTVIKHDSILLAVTQGEKTVAYIERKDGQSVLKIGQEYFDALAAENEQIRALGGTAENGFYSLNIQDTRLGQDLNIQDLQVSGTDGQTFSISFSALGCHISGNGTKADIRNLGNFPFDMVVSTQFLQNALTGANGCSYGEGTKKISDKVMQNLLISSIRLDREDAESMKLKPISQKFGLYNIISVPVNKTGVGINYVEFFVDTRNNRPYIYHHSMGTASKEDYTPELSQIRDCQLQSDGHGNYQLSLGLGNGDKQRLVIPISNDKDFIDNINYLQDSLLAKQFGATQSLLLDGANPVNEHLTGTNGKYKFNVYTAPQQGQEVNWDENIATLQRTIVEEVEQPQEDEPKPEESEKKTEDDHKPEEEKPKEEKPKEEKPQEEKPQEEKPKEEKPQEEKPKDEKKESTKDEKKFKPLIGRVRTPFKWFKKNAIDKDWFGGLAFFILLVGAIIPPVAIVGGLFLGLWVGKKTGLTDDWSKMMDEIEASRLPKDKRLERNKELTKQMLKEDCQKAQQREIDRLKNVAKAKVNAYNRLANETPTLKAQAKAKLEADRKALLNEKKTLVEQGKDKLSASIQAQIDRQQAEIDHVKELKAAQEKLSEDQKKLQKLEKERARMLKKYSKKSYIDQYGSAEFALQNEGTQKEITRFGEIIADRTNTLTKHGLEKPEDIQAAIDANSAELETFIEKGPGAFKAYIDAHESTIGALKKLKETVETLSLDTQPVEVVKPERQGLLVGQSAQDLDLLNGAIGDYNDTNTAIAHNTDAPMQEYNQTISTLDANLSRAKASMEQARQDLQVFQEAVKNETDKFSVEYKQKAEEMDKFFQDQIDEIQRKAAEKKAKEERKKRERRAKRIKHETLAENEYVTVDENGLETISIEETPQQEQPAEQQQEQPAEQQPSEDEEIDPETGLPKSRGKGPKGTPSTGAQVGGDGGGGADLGGNGK